MKRELKVKELQLLEASRRRFLKFQQDQRSMELTRLDDEISRKVSRLPTFGEVRERCSGGGGGGRNPTVFLCLSTWHT